MPEGGPPKKKKTADIFANARTTPNYADGSVGAGMHNTLVCPACGAARESAKEGDLFCRYCGTKLAPQARK